MCAFYCQRIPVFPLLFAIVAFALPVNAQKPVRFSWGVVQMPPNGTAFMQRPEVVESDPCGNGVYVRCLQFEKSLSSAQRKMLVRQGVQMYDYLHQHTYVVGLPADFNRTILAPLGLTGALPVQAEWKLAKSLREKPYGSWAYDGRMVQVNLQLYPHANPVCASKELEDLGVRVLHTGQQPDYLVAWLPEPALLAVAALPTVRFMELTPPPGKPEDTNGRSMHRANLLDSDNPFGYRFDGTGVAVLVRDDGVVGPHIDFKGRLINLTDDLTGSHGDGVGGIMGGAGNLNPNNRGMAAGSDVYVINYEASFQDQTLDLHLQEGVKITNSSYSNGCNTGYTTAAQTVDRQLFQYPSLMHVFSGGNSNNVNCNYGAGSQWGNITGGHKMAKNAVAAANLNALGILENSSSRGPAHDGRIKPDIAAHGQGQISTETNNQYQTFGGTSAAAPGIAGCMAQLFHAYRFFNGGSDPATGLLKAAMLNTADDLGNPGPDFRFGWGRVNAGKALSVLENTTWLSGTIDQGDVRTHTLVMPSGVRQARVMLLWTDPEGSVLADRALVNDLDMTLFDATGAARLPWILDPTPDPAALDKPATLGRDSLNNMEQVALLNPAPGIYFVRVEGFDVPFGPQSYYLVWYMDTDSIKLTYPAGGEALQAGQSTRLYWDAFGNDGTFSLTYSTDGGATYKDIATVGADRRSYDWNVPNTIEGAVKVAISRNGIADETDLDCNIAPLPKGMAVTRVCPDSMTIGFELPADSLAGVAWVLGDRYMEQVAQGARGATEVTFPIATPHLEKWVSTSLLHPNGLVGPRNIAIRQDGGLLNCAQPNDMALRKVVSPGSDAFISCGVLERYVSVIIANEGLNTATAGFIHYRIDDGPEVSEALPDLPPGAETTYAFADPAIFSGSGTISLSVWLSYPSDDYRYNDTINLRLPIVAETTAQPFVQTFEEPVFPPSGWVLGNPDSDMTWARVRDNGIVGPAGVVAPIVALDCYNYSNRGEEDYLYLIPVDLSQTAAAALVFSLAHAQFNNNFKEALRVEVFPDCDLSGGPVVVWSKQGDSLATVPATTSRYFPNSINHWRQELIDLSPFLGGSVIIRFTAVNDYGNNIYLGNIGIDHQGLLPPVAAIIASGDTICRNQPSVFSSPDQGPLAIHSWSFGAFATPGSAVGPGPHTVQYTTPGTRNVRLIVRNPVGSDTAVFPIVVRNPPVANFSVSVKDLEVSLTNKSTNADAFLWSFGDGNSSTEQEPVHAYAQAGDYAIVLQATSQCSTSEQTQSVTATAPVSTTDLWPDDLRVQVTPNPNGGAFALWLQGSWEGTVQVDLMDAQGRWIHRQSAAVGPQEAAIQFNGLGLAKGAYLLRIQADEGVQTLSILVQ